MIDKTRARMGRTWVAVACVVSLGLMAVPVVSLAGEAPPTADHVPGLRYERYVLEDPRPIRVHVLQVDLAAGELEPVVALSENPPQEDRNATRTDPRALAADARTVAFINTNPWRPWGPDYPRRVQITGLAATEGEVRSEPGRVSVWSDPDGRVHVGDPPAEASIQEGMGGFRRLLADGAVVVEPDRTAHPRTAIAVNEAGDRIWLVVVDGRAPGVSEGMTYYEVARFIHDELVHDELAADDGPWAAAGMDGGGSSIMGLVDEEGALRLISQPPDGHVRHLPMALTIRRIERDRQ